MNQQNKPLGTQSEENVLFGIIGAFLFALVGGGVVYVVLSMLGFLSALSGLIGVVCAIKGYSFFAKGESKKGIVISVIIAAVVIIIAWYVSFCLDMVEAYQYWYETGEVDYAPTFFEYVPFAHYDLVVNPAYFANLLISLGLGAVGCFSYVSQTVKRQKALAAQMAAQAETQELLNAQAAQAAEATEASEPAQNEPDAWAELNARAESSDESNEA